MRVIVQKKVFRFEVSMHDSEFRNVLDSRDDLLEELAGIFFFYFLVGDNVIKELSSISVLHD